MSVKRVKPTTPGQRFKIVHDFSPLTKKKPEKSLLYPVKSRAGRNNTGVVTVPHRGGGHKRRGRIIDFKRRKHGVEGVVKAIEYDPMRSAFIMLVFYKDGEKAYLIAPAGITIGTTIVAGKENVPPEIGNAMPLKAMPLGSIIHNVEFIPGKGGACARSAGTYAQLIAVQEKNAVLKFPSGERRMVNKNCIATIGSVSNEQHNAIILGKAGGNRWRGRRPNVRGTVQNAARHPMGGGEGKSSGGHPRSKQGLYAKGQKTRKNKKYSDKMILKRSR